MNVGFRNLKIVFYTRNYIANQFFFLMIVFCWYTCIWNNVAASSFYVSFGQFLSRLFAEDYKWTDWDHKRLRGLFAKCLKVSPPGSLSYHVAREFLNSLFLRIVDFLRFAGTNFCVQDKVVFLAGNKFLRFSGNTQYPALIKVSFLLSTCRKKYIFLNNATVCVPYVKLVFHCLVSEWKKQVAIEWTDTIS